MGMGKNIKYLRESKGYTQDELGLLLKVSGKTVSSWEIDRTEPKMGKIQEMSDLFNCLNSDIIEGPQFKMKEVPSIRIPVLGFVRAGIPMEAVENIIDYEEISQEMANRGEFFALKLKGDSMQPRLSDGDVVIVKKQSSIQSGELAIVLIDGKDATCKKFVKHDNGISLVSFNPNYSPMFYTCSEVDSLPITIIGKVIEARLKFGN